MIERIPPQNVDAELSVLGAAVTNKEAAIKATDVLQAAFPLSTWNGTRRSCWKKRACAA